MKYLKIYENFMDSRNSGIAADLEAGEMKNDQIYADMDVDNFGMEESQFGAEEIMAKWHEKFGEKGNPSTQDKYDFYADLREEGFDGILIFDTLGDKMNNDTDEENFSRSYDDDVELDKNFPELRQNESNDEECKDCKCAPCKCDDDEECDKCKCTPCKCDDDDEECDKCKCAPCKCK